MDIKEIHDQQMFHKENLINVEENQLLQHVMDFAKMGLKGIFILNGTAAISLLTLFTHIILIEKYDIAHGIFWATITFAVGAALSSLSIFLAWYAQGKFQDTAYYANLIEIARIRTSHSKDDKLDYIKKMHIKEISIDEKNDKFFKSLKIYQEENNKYIDEQMKKESSSRLKGNFTQGFVVFIIFLAFAAFFYGIFLTYDSLECVIK